MRSRQSAEGWRPGANRASVQSRAVRDLAHSRTGAGAPFIWAHGLTSSRANEDEAGLLDWSPIVEAGRELIRYDAAGHGQTGGPLDPSCYEWARLAVDLLGFADDLGFDRVSAGGASMGCATVLHAAVMAPGRFDRLVLACPPTAWETRPAQSAGYELVATFVEERGLAAFTRAARAMPRPAIFASAPEPAAADIPEALLPHVFRGAAASDLPAPGRRRADRPAHTRAGVGHRPGSSGLDRGAVGGAPPGRGAARRDVDGRHPRLAPDGSRLPPLSGRAPCDTPAPNGQTNHRFCAPARPHTGPDSTQKQWLLGCLDLPGCPNHCFCAHARPHTGPAGTQKQWGGVLSPAGVIRW